MDRPDRRGREAILKVHVRGKPLSPDIDLGVIAAQTPGMVGADLENLINEAAILAARRNKRSIGMDELVESIERVMAGPARRSRVLDERDRRTIAFHEAGHAIVMERLQHTDEVGKITIVSRGQALGYVMPLPRKIGRSRVAPNMKMSWPDCSAVVWPRRSSSRNHPLAQPMISNG